MCLLPGGKIISVDILIKCNNRNFLKMNLYPARTSQMYNSLQNSANYIKQRITHCEISIICDSDYDFMVDNLENSQIINYADIPNFPSSTGSLHYGNISNKAILCWINRLYCYEGYSHYQSAYISHLTAFLGVHTNLVLNSSDLSMNNTSDIVFLTDYIKQSGEDPLDIGLAAYLKTSLQVSNDQTQLIDFCIDIGQSLNIDCTKGVYLTYRGPSFPTPYEIENYSKLGADVLTTNSIVEYLAGKIHGLRVMVLSVFIKDQYAL